MLLIIYTTICWYQVQKFYYEFGKLMELPRYVVVVKIPCANVGDRRDAVRSLGWEDPLE